MCPLQSCPIIRIRTAIASARQRKIANLEGDRAKNKLARTPRPTVCHVTARHQKQSWGRAAVPIAKMPAENATNIA